MKISRKTMFLLPALILLGCNQEAPSTEIPIKPEPDPQPQQVELKVLSFSLADIPDAVCSIDEREGVLSAVIPYGCTATGAVLEYECPQGVTGRPESGSTISLASPGALFLRAEDGSARKYTISVEKALRDGCRIIAASCRRHYENAVIGAESVSITLPYGADLAALPMEITLSPGASAEPDPRAGIDLREDTTVRVTAEDGVHFTDYLFHAEALPQDVGVRGVYLPAPSHTSSFMSYENARSSLDLMKELNFNCLFLCAWAQTKTAWNSEVLLRNSSYSSAEEGNLYRSYSGGSGDALSDIIALAHERGIKVMLWFEYGLMHKVGGVDLGDPLLSRHPDWIGMNSKGGYANYNNNDFYLSGYNPEVRQFMLDLMAEAIAMYPDIDGIQGDDRLPANPRDSGYDEATRELYRSQTGAYPPENPESWVEWRRNSLNELAVDIYKTAKALKPDIWVCFAPNKYPWCDSMLLQDWPQWIADGAVDLLTVQFYVTSTYMGDVEAALDYVRKSGGGNILNPAMILKNGEAILMESILLDELRFNRSRGTCGESQFWFDGLRTPYVQEVFRGMYPGPALFPALK